MSAHAPWKIDPARFVTPRPLYLRGTWTYAVGKSARSHPRYRTAVALARQAGWSSWWIRTWSDVEAVLAGCRFDVDAGYDVVQFFSHLRHSKGKWGGQVFQLADWQLYDVVMPLFGWKRSDGLRRFRRGYIEIPKKNGKTTLSSGLTLYLLFYDGEPGAEVYSAAVDREQAGMVYQAASAMVRQSPELNLHLRCIDSRKRIVYQEANSFYAALSADVASKEGLNIHGAIFDELHVYPNRDMWDTLKDGGAARTQPLQISITTAGVFDPTSLGWEQHQYALNIRDAKLEAYHDWAQFVFIAGLDESEHDDWMKPRMWIKANPSWGITVFEEEIAEMCQVAQNQPSAQNTFKRRRLDIWTQQRSVWIDSSSWNRLGGEYSEDDLRGETCYGGIDLSLTQDITACVFWFPGQEEGDPHRFIERFWVPEDNIRAGDEAYNGLYSIWVNSGFLMTTPGNVVAYDEIREYILSQARQFNLKRICYDKWNSMQLVLELQNEGIEMIAHGQGFAAMTDPTKRFADLVASGGILHRKNPVFDWMVGNSMIISDTNGNVRVIKGEARGTGKGRVRYKVDGVIAAIMALSGAMADAEKPSVYEKRGVLVI